MVSVASLLNPLPPPLTKEPDCVSPGNHTPRSPPSPASPRTNLDMEKSKSAPTIVKCKGNAKANFKPCEFEDHGLAAEHLRFHMSPLRQIRENPRHIPYSSDKKSFQQKTGRDAIDAYLYTFRMPGDTKDEHTIMWDYNIGLVRITALFKSLKHSKTMPAKVMSANKGLREISHSITGGSITAQGYWVPFEAAKAVAATFCWNIRYALTPVFGAEFPKLCIEPGNPHFGSLKIDPAIVRRCEEAAYKYRVESQGVPCPEKALASSSSRQEPPRTPISLRPKMTDFESGYGTDSERSPFGSPISAGSDLWVSVNTPRSVNWAHYQFPTPKSTPSNATLSEAKAVARVSHEKKLSKKRGRQDHGQLSDKHPTSSPVISKRPKISTTSDVEKLTQEALAAQILMELHRADRVMSQRVRAMSRRASL